MSLLLDQGIAVRALKRSPGADASFGEGVEFSIGDVTKPGTLGGAFDGITTVISTIGGSFPIGKNGFSAVDWQGNRALIDQAKAAGVVHFILLSAGSAGRKGFPFSLPIAPYPWKAKSEAYLRASGLPYTIIAAGGLRDNPGGETGIRLVSRADYKSNMVSRSDVASVLAACIGNEEALGKTITVVNDESLAPDDWQSAFAGLPKDS